MDPISQETTLALGMTPAAPSREDLRDRYSRKDPIGVEAFAGIEAEDQLDAAVTLWKIHGLLADGAEVPEKLVAQMLKDLTDSHVRDALLMSAIEDEQEKATEEVMAYLTRRAPFGLIAPPATAAAILAWQMGSGTRSRIAVAVAVAARSAARAEALAKAAIVLGADDGAAFLASCDVTAWVITGKNIVAVEEFSCSR